MYLPIVTIPDDVWNEAFDEAADGLIDYLVRRGGHGRQPGDVKACILFHLDKVVMMTWLGKQMISKLTQDVADEFEVDLELQVEKAELTDAGTLKAIVLTSSLHDAKMIFNCNAFLDPARRFEKLRDRTGSLRQAEWGLLLDRFLGFLDAARTREDVFRDAFRQLRTKGVIHEAMVHGLDQEGLQHALYGNFPLSMDEGIHSIH